MKAAQRVSLFVYSNRYNCSTATWTGRATPTQEAPPFFQRPRGYGKKIFFVTGYIWILIYGLFLSGDTKSEENGNVNAKFKTNLLRAGIEPAT